MKIPQEPLSYSQLHTAPLYTESPRYLCIESPRVCCITLNETDRIRLIDTPPELTRIIREIISTSWGGIQHEREYHGAYEFKINGNPWQGQGFEAVKSRRLITGVLRAMAENGWNLIQAADVSKKQRDKDSLFFESVAQTTGVVDVGQVDMFSVSFNRTDRIRVIDAPAYIPHHVKQAIQTKWRSGIQQEQMYEGSIEFKLRGNPFHPESLETVQSRMMLAQMLANLRSQGYKLYTSVDISIGTEGMDVESWVFRRVGPAWS
ncbi:hypothetical protein EDD21DRAFT_330398 [Dissophora ornata]|nr:hypothetical protein BGZ58_002859 [Dissophora ornata]KAI8606772.1 hypothetical protein EDD21DRAFT_330398 [Dissophora ornata]